MLLLVGLVVLCCGQGQSAIRTATFLVPPKQEITEKKETRKQKRWQKRLDRFEKKIQKKMERLRKKSKRGGRLGLDFIGLTVLLVGGLFIVLGLAIPYVGVLFIVIGAIIAFVGLLLLLLLGGISVEVN